MAAGDYDRDGWVDLTNFGPNHLLKNNGGDTFVDVTKIVGDLADPR